MKIRVLVAIAIETGQRTEVWNLEVKNRGDARHAIIEHWDTIRNKGEELVYSMNLPDAGSIG